MNQTALVQRLLPGTGSALAGGAIGALVVALGSVISGSPFAVGATIAVATILGAFVGRLSGAIIGGTVGVLSTAFGSVIGGTQAGAVVTIIACAVMAVFLESQTSRRTRQSEAPSRYRAEAECPTRFDETTFGLSSSPWMAGFARRGTLARAWMGGNGRQLRVDFLGQSVHSAERKN